MVVYRQNIHQLTRRYTHFQIVRQYRGLEALAYNKPKRATFTALTYRKPKQATSTSKASSLLHSRDIPAKEWDAIKDVDVGKVEEMMKGRFGEPGTWSKKALHELGFMDRPTPFLTGIHFMLYVLGGSLPGNGRPSLPLWHRDEVQTLDRLLDHRIREFAAKKSFATVWFPARLHPIKAKIWNGMARTAETLDLTTLWAEYFDAITTTMSTRTHQWLIDRVEEIQKNAHTEYETTLHAAGNDQEATLAAGKDFFARMRDLNGILAKADTYINVPTQATNNGIQNLSIQDRQIAYDRLSQIKSWENHQPFANPSTWEKLFQDHDALMRIYHEGISNRALIRRELRGEPKELGEEPWITALKVRDRQSGGKSSQRYWGFVCYRLTYKHTDEEWAEFKHKFESDLRKPREWIQGAEDVMDKAGVYWADGQRAGIPEGDIDAAKKHFVSTMPTVLGAELADIWHLDFLVVDAASYASYAKPMEDNLAPFGDMGGYVQLVDVARDMTAAEGAPDTFSADAASTGFSGTLTVQTSLLFEDVYPLFSGHTLRPHDLWILARLHPQQVYVGHTVASQEEEWERQREELHSYLDGFFTSIRKMQAEGKSGTSGEE
ncbi:hypothetical protein BDV95DRAFT_656205 [Massariosphaeria phaeospora]|uniref:Uncharacterized protein n=1 Tax=Massariosphaeria phaeospora TaxID=100035 RepID=A0A7C8M9N8_9PLEO|nr:hypothetical protein BDV95DRAFT_656205 [Massariosphaeria phaeospora]